MKKGSLDLEPLMTTVVLDQTTIQKLVVTLTTVEVRDEEGNVVGHFSPKIRPEDVDQFESPFSDEEIERRSKNAVGRPLAEILSDLRKLRP